MCDYAPQTHPIRTDDDLDQLQWEVDHDDEARKAYEKACEREGEKPKPRYTNG